MKRYVLLIQKKQTITLEKNGITGEPTLNHSDRGNNQLHNKTIMA